MSLLAHSLGNMVVCSAIQDHGFRPDRYFMLNAAVPAEAFDAPAGANWSSGNPLIAGTTWAGWERQRFQVWKESPSGIPAPGDPTPFAFLW